MKSSQQSEFGCCRWSNALRRLVRQPRHSIVAIDLETDPLADGLAASLARPGGNVTGVFMDFRTLPRSAFNCCGDEFGTFARSSPLDPGHGVVQLDSPRKAAFVDENRAGHF